MIVDVYKRQIKKYAQPRKTEIVYADDIITEAPEEEIPDYAVNYFFTKDGYFKKITPLSLRMGGEQKLKDGDQVIEHIESNNNADLLFFTDQCQVYKAKGTDFPDSKASVLGEYIPAKLGMDPGENAVYMAVTKEYTGFMLFAFENGKVAKVEMSAYATKTNRKKLLSAYNDKSSLCGILYVSDDCELLFKSSHGRLLLTHSGAISAKTTRATQGVSVMMLKRGHRLASMERYPEGYFKNPNRYRKKIPAAGALLADEDAGGEQLHL